MGTGLTANGIAGIQAAAAQHVSERNVPGLVALVACGDDVFLATAP